jgi:hypothetical protein
VVSVEEVGAVGRKVEGGEEGKEKTGGENRRKKKVGGEKGKWGKRGLRKINVWTEWKREIGNTRL